MSKSETFKPRGDYVWGSLALTFCALYLIQAAVYPSGSWFEVLAGVALAIAALLFWFRPKLVLREHDLIVVNPFSTKTIAYRDIIDLETRWSLRIVHSAGSTRVWVAPASGKHRWIAESTTKWSSERLPTNPTKTVEVTTMSNSHFSDSGAAATLIQQRLDV
jgi:hypothetical protein